MRARLLVHGIVSALLFAVLGGIADVWTTPHAFLDRSFLGLAVLAWATCLLPAGLILGALASVLVAPAREHRFRSAPGLAALLTGGLAVGPTWFLVVVHVNVVHLASDTGRDALLFDAVSVVAALVVLLGGAHLLHAAFRRAGHPLRRALFSGWGPPGLAGVALALAAALWRGGVGDVGPPRNRPPEDAPNVALVLIDTLRRDHLSGEGYGRETSPALDALADRGVRFPDFVSQSTYTKPAVASLLTSQYPSGHGVGHLRTVLADDRVTLTERFHAAGWRTAEFVSNTIISPEFGFAQGAELFDTLPTELIPKTKLGYALFRLTDSGRNVPGCRQAAAVLRALERRLGGRRGADVLELHAPEILAAFDEWRGTLGGAPYFAYLHFMEPHAPYRPPEPEAGRFAEGVPLVDEHPPAFDEFLPFREADALPPARVDGMIRAYDAEIAALDRELSAFLRALLDDDGRPTIVVVTSDHGEEFYEHGGWGHGRSLHREQLEVPLAIAGPGVPAGGEVRGPAQIVDIAPTLMELAGLPATGLMVGRSLVPAMRAAGAGEARIPEDREHFAEVVYGDAFWARSLRVGRWKAILSRLDADVRVQLFDVKADPGEEHDLADSRPERAAEMVGRIEQLAAEAAAGRGAGGTAEFDPVTQERLRALGYVE